LQTGRTLAARFVVGLGNPGRRYVRTRHNAGFRVLETLRRRWQAPEPRKTFCGHVTDVRLPARAGGEARRVVLLAPQTYMNDSGKAVLEMTKFYKADCRDVLVVLDDLALPPGRLRARACGSAGGHKGLADILRVLGTERVPRLRIGIGAAPPEMEAEDYVLAKFGPQEGPTMEEAFDLAADAVEDWIFGDIECVMQEYNRPGGTEDQET